MAAATESLTKEEDRLNNQYPVNRIQASNNIGFKIYSGVEHYFQNGCYDKERKEDASQKISGKNEYVIWAVKDSAARLTIYKPSDAYPFISLPNETSDNIKFKLPG